MQACTLDLEKFHCTVPACPAHKPWLVVQGQPGEFYIDHCVPSECASASSNAGMITNAGVDIMHAENIGPALKYEDDFKIMRLPVIGGKYLEGGYSYDVGPDEVKQVLAPALFPCHPTKGDGVFRDVTDFIGFRWDITNKTVTLPEKKRLKFY